MALLDERLGRNATGDGARIHPNSERQEALPAFVSTFLEAVLIVDFDTLKIIEADPAAATFLLDRIRKNSSAGVRRP